MKPHTKPFLLTEQSTSPRFANYQQPTQASNSKQTRSFSRKTPQNSQERWLFHRQEAINGPLELQGRRKLLRKEDSGGSLLGLLQKTPEYPRKPAKNLKTSSPSSSYRVFQPELNCETPKFQGLRTFYADFLNIDPINNKVLGKANFIENIENRGKLQRKFSRKEDNKENNIPCLPVAPQEKARGKKIFKEKENVSSSFLLKNFENLLNISNTSLQNQEETRKSSKTHNKSQIFAGNQEKIDKSRESPRKHLKSIHILPEGQEKQQKRAVLRYPNQKRIMQGDHLFWENFKKGETSGDFKKNEQKVTNLEYKDCVHWILKEKENFERFLNNEALDTSNGSIYREKRKKQFPHSPIFKTNIQLG